MPCRSTRILLAGGLVVVGVNVAQEPPPQRTDLLERAERALAQIDVTVEGPLEAIVGLERRDFVLTVGGRAVEAFDVDRQCATPSASATGDRSARAAAPIAPPAQASYLFYFDQHMLTIGGRATSIVLARDLIGRLIQNGSRAAIVSAGRRLVTFADWSSDTAILLDALERLEHDPTQVDEYPASEEYRQIEVLRQLRIEPAYQTFACAAARGFAREEVVRVESALALFATTLGRFVDVGSPKLAVYFADLARLDPGRHYFVPLDPSLCPTDSFDARGEFRRVVEEAAAMEIRVYAVQAEGLVAASGRRGAEMRDVAAAASQSGLKAIALDTGGDAFLNGTSAERMARRIAADAGCRYLLSFDPSGFPEDQPLLLRVDVRRTKVRARTRSVIVLQSEGARRMSRLLAAFVSPETVPDRLPVGAAVVPIGFANGSYTALVQAVLPAGLLPREEWDVGISVLSGGTARDDVARRITLGQAGIRAVLEAELSFRPGPFEVVFVGQESASGRIATGQLAGSWPDVSDGPAIGPLALLQSAAATFVRGDAVRSEGSLVLATDAPVRGDRSLEFLGIVCRGPAKKKTSTTLAVLRTLTGEHARELAPLDLVLDPEPCARVRDVIPADTLVPGAYTYEMRIAGTNVALARAFQVVAPEAVASTR